MEPIPEAYINAIPSSVEPDKESCTMAADNSLLALFFLSSQSESAWITFPPIVSNHHEVWPLPAPWAGREDSQLQLLRNLNGTEGTREGTLTHVKRNCEEFNEALATNDLPLANRIIAIAPGDCASVWNDCNALAFSLEKEDVYRPLLLSEETKEAFEDIPNGSTPRP